MDTEFLRKSSYKRRPWTVKKSNIVFHADFEASSIFTLKLLLCFYGFVGFWEPVDTKELI